MPALVLSANCTNQSTVGWRFRVDGIGAFQSATIARRGCASSRKRLLLGFCSWLVPLRSPQNPAGTSRRAPCLRRAGAMAEMHLNKSSTEPDAATGGLQSSVALRNIRSRSPIERRQTPRCNLLRSHSASPLGDGNVRWSWAVV